MSLQHISCLEHTEIISTSEGKKIPVWKLNIPEDESVLSAWAIHFRNHYCLDEELDALRDGTGLSRKDYLLELAFPDCRKPPGPAVRSGDFAEILISDFLENVSGYWVPRDKYADKAVRDESVKGVDIIGIKLVDVNVDSNNPRDILIVFEVKAKLTAKKYGGTLQDAVKHSQKDSLRRAFTLNATKRRLLRKDQEQKALIVRRFQNPTDHPYVYKSGAAAVISNESYDAEQIANTVTTAHENADNLDLVVFYGTDLMSLVSALYDRAANEA